MLVNSRCLLVFELGGVVRLQPRSDRVVFERPHHASAVLDLDFAQRVRLRHQLNEA